MNRKIVSVFSTAKDTCLKQLHIDNKGKIVDFAGNSFLTKVIIYQSCIPRESSRNIFSADPVLLFSMFHTWVS